jgi:GH24 family phage-related lysozyme (muramidase)
MTMMNISQRGIKALIAWETGGESLYDRNPEWPGGESGVTIGIGWDLGHTPVIETTRAWAKHLDAQTMAALVGVSGRKGENAKTILPHVRHLVIPWAAALAVFEDTTLPTWYLRTLRVYPQLVDLPGDCAAALVSLVFNRGPSLVGDRRIEMAAIRDLMRVREWQHIPDQFRAMKRLWPESRGLRRRRDEEADLFEAGLAMLGE